MLVFALSVTAYWLAAKCFLFWGLDYKSDAYVCLQLGRNFVERGLWLVDNCFGRYSATHNHYAVLLFGPLLSAFGLYGLFLGTSLLNGLAMAWLARRPELSARFKWGWLLAFASPLAFYLFDDPREGWHLEQLYPAAAALSTLSLLAGRRAAAAASLALLILIKEDAAFVGAAITLAVLLVAGRGDRPAAARRSRARPAVLALLGWGVVLGAGFAFLNWQRTLWNPGLSAWDARATQAVSVLVQGLGDAGYRGYLLSTLGSALAAVLVAALFFPPAVAGRTLAHFAWLGVPVVAVQTFSAAFYGADPYYGLLWPPRFAPMWGVFLGIAVCAAWERPERAGRPRLPAWAAAALAVAAMALQVRLVRSVRGYVFLDRFLPFLPGPASRLDLAKLEPEEIGFVERLSREIPRRTPVMTEGVFFRYFHRHDIVWPLPMGARKRPEYILCDERMRYPRDYGEDCLRLLAEAGASSPVRRVGGLALVALGPPEPR